MACHQQRRAPEWQEDGTVSLDPSSVIAVTEYDNLSGGCVVFTVSGKDFSTRMSRTEMLAQIQSALP